VPGDDRSVDVTRVPAVDTVLMSSVVIRRTVVFLTAFATAPVVGMAGPAAAVVGEPDLASVSQAGEPGNSVSGRQAISADGRYVVFETDANNLFPNDYNVATDVVLRDRWTGTTSRVSVSATGGETDLDSGEPAISSNGRYVAFESDATNVVAGDTNEATDVFVLDRATGVTSRVSRPRAGGQANGRSYRPSISGNGRYVAFESDATNLVAGDTGETADAYVYDRRTGVTTRESMGFDGEPNGPTTGVVISGDGTHVTFSSFASNLVPGDTNASTDVFVRDRRTRVTKRVNISSAGIEAGEWSESFGATISADGRYVSFESTASNLVPGDTNDRSDIFQRDVRAGVTRRISVTGAGEQANAASFAASTSADGRRVAFLSYATNLIPGDSPDTPDLFVRDVRSGTTTAVAPGFDPTISANGRYVAFVSGQQVLVADPAEADGRAPCARATAVGRAVRDTGPALDDVGSSPEMSITVRPAATAGRP
jgi:Tol biopolymer transport system component